MIAKLDGSGEVLNGALDREQTSAAAVDLSNGDVYLDNVSKIAAFDPSGSLIQRFGSGSLSKGAGMAIDSKTGQVYVADGKEKVDVFKPEEPGAPSVDSESAQNLTPTSERLSAQIDPKGAETHYFFQYGTVNCETSPSSCTEVPAGGASIWHLEQIRSIVGRLAEEAGVRDTESFARSWHILMKGSIIAASEGDSHAAQRGKAMARLLIEQHR